MTGSLADYWDTLCPALPPALATPADRERLERLAKRMAPVPRIGLECRLGDPAPKLDLQQCIRRHDGEPALLRDFVQASGDDGEAWARVRGFCAAWADPTTTVHREIDEVFLEYDVGTAPQPTLTPSVFFALRAGEADPRGTAQAALALLLPKPWPTGLAENLSRCFAACPSGARVAYLGAMLGRATQDVRVNVKGLRLDDLAGFLGTLGWDGPLPAVERWAEWAYDSVDRVTVCVDVGTVVHPHLALECALTLQPPAEPRWEALLEEASHAGLCPPENAAAYLSVPGILRPHDSEAGWPAPWIAATMAGPTDSFSTTERRLSHVKLNITERLASLKGYWGAGHVWHTVHRPGSGASDGCRERSGRPRSNPSVADALARATAFLLGRQAHTGRWSDFIMPAGPSDEWVTAFVGACLLAAPSEHARSAAGRAWEALLRRRRDEPGWGYNRLTPADADSTAWALRLAAGLGVAPDERVGAARRFVARHVLASGGVTTYAARDRIRRYARLPGGASLAGWQAAHPCVTAAAAPFVGTAAMTYLESQQDGTGHWPSYWWWDDEYTTALAAEAAATTRSPAVSQAVAWAEARVSTAGAVDGSDGRPSPWATAWCTRILRLGTTSDAQEACARAARWLLDAQHDDGGWRGSARMRVPAPGEVDPGGQAPRIDCVDESRVFTTAAVVAALGMAFVTA